MEQRTVDLMQKKLKRRYAAEWRFQWYGRISILIALAFLLLMFINIVGKGYSAFQQTHIRLAVELEADTFPSPTSDTAALYSADYSGLIKMALRKQFPDVTNRRDKRALYQLLSSGAGYNLRDLVVADPALIGQTIEVWLTADDDVDMYIKHSPRDNTGTEPTAERLSEKQRTWLEQLHSEGRIEKQFNSTFFSAGDSREPEQAGIWGALVGTFFTLLVTICLSFPIGVGAAIYLEEFAPKNKWTDLIEVNVNNLAAVPSIVFGLLGLAVFINFFGVPRSAPIAGGLVLTLMTLPVIIISSRAVLKAVPPSIREAALGIGASKVQMVFSHVVPLALPGMLTGTIIGMGRALGETAPLLMIGMMAFVVDIPANLFDSSTALPVQIYLWADSPERGFEERTSAAIMVLLAFLVVMNAAAVYLRKRFERKW
ncbi:MAG: phosphate ABC transporter permease PstA [Gammaproteobacteria bacterium]|nr:phosphate ABC transporter permease PstA [Gammaproteobacteria bacterium]